MSVPLISICIPAYKRAEYLERLLQSIAIQGFRDFEVVISDDSCDPHIIDLVSRYSPHFGLKYFSNEKPLGSPANWNNAIKKASGTWIKLMHDDDWFANKNSLLRYAEAVKSNPEAYFLFSGYYEVNISTGSKRKFIISDFWLNRLKSSPLYLFKKNFIGHPSTTLIKNTSDVVYDVNLKWVVDIEFYMRFLFSHRNVYAIRTPLINIGIGEDQITKVAFRNPEIEIPEVMYLARKIPAKAFHNIFVYDYYWRFLRNLDIKSDNDILKYSPGLAIPPLIKRMINLQSRVPLSWLKKGFISKPVMLFSYLTYFFKR